MPDDKKPSSFFKRGSGVGEVRKVPSAPPPITPVRGSASSWEGRPLAIPPSWDEWAMMDAVTVYEAAALSLDLEPRRHGPNDRYSFPNDQTVDKFWMRCRIIEEGDWHALGRSEYRVSLPAFAAWAVAKGMEIPAELRALAACGEARQPAASTALGAHEQTESSGKSESRGWQEVARTIADELHKADANSRAHDSLRNIAERVAVELRTRRINGPRGPLSGNTVLREALQGGKWKRKA